MCIPLPSPDTPSTTSISSADQQPKALDSSTKDARAEDRRRASIANGRASTLLTGSLGTSTRAQTTSKSLLGQ